MRQVMWVLFAITPVLSDVYGHLTSTVSIFVTQNTLALAASFAVRLTASVKPIRKHYTEPRQMPN